MPLYLFLRCLPLTQLPAAAIIFHAVFQGFLVTVVSLLLYGRSVANLGANGGPLQRSRNNHAQ